MTDFSPAQEAKLLTCDERLQRLARAVNAKVPIVIVYGHRDQVDQDNACATGHSKVKWPHSPHNAFPSRAMDIAPAPLDWNNERAFEDLAPVVMAEAATLGIPIRWGGAFTTIRDLDHYELYGDNNGAAGPVST